MRWKFTNATVTGKAHTARGEPGQDSSRAGTVQISDTDFFIGIAADGAGSTTDGGRGADIACRTLFALITDALRESGDLSLITDDVIRNWITASHEAIVTEAQERGKKLRQYASTVIGAIAGNERAIFFQIGDGAIVTGSGPEYQTIFWPEQGEYANTTYFITDDDYLGHVKIHHSETPEEIALFTDGLQNLVLSFAEKKAHTGFFRPLFDALKQNPESGISDFSSRMEHFLCRDDISARSDDDKTLILAVRRTG
jgi:hypothetical protein